MKKRKINIKKKKKLEDYNKTEASEEETEGLVKNELEQVNLILGKNRCRRSRNNNNITGKTKMQRQRNNIR